MKIAQTKKASTRSCAVEMLKYSSARKGVEFVPLIIYISASLKAETIGTAIGQVVKSR